METQTTQHNEQLAAVDRRLVAVETSVAVLTQNVAGLTQNVAVLTEKVAALTVDVAVLAKTSASKEDLAHLETRLMKWMITTLVGVAALNSTMVLIVVKLMQT
ncbi:hypothetical protein GJ699_01515 [Duganella sp. FT80W]|uniref:DUF1640 domain-containing protein n=1 Tax=Duganella guangzhouensis TaxID=2666084 RepID=A0A6I2KTL3_9BURK|nr:hypothetical protein [Duganella guangzhouensis]MRW88660.1 hypothetical protein [Duganella guangzhouensis]